MPRIRLFVDQPLGSEQTVELTRDQAHYLFGVMRLGEGAELAVFNGRDGEWQARVESAGKRGGTILCEIRTAEQWHPPDLWLLFAPVKKTATDFIVEKAVEMGVSRLCPVQTEFTNSERIRRDRLQAHAVEAAEQCGAVTVPEVAELARLDRVLADWPEERGLVFCDEGLVGDAVARELPPAPAALLIGPEGGFSEQERGKLAGLAQSLSLGPRILRAETAAVAALALWQAACGDWR
ncbi:16S rRNA (uracil(1498)-N(3))-methyltransferase [Histidinibacterium aquaticum]|uniref:Ribosomal RNA small subunit methyltransferase E n=1 Tax=Histidinibacterium aquaticum TaxID=2613962 RepID=A0A5J5GQ92_9RHOB|nr:16S rRNA (uracil(1498)-N(3))-methyltransferase [Histidinibacterium aquaticum]KAA9010566.1 16S rRNA (uracil(1498)-N(3))-methyltransferase [Histidinibacterium aquaticum]